ncbi:hypothetical protein PENSPDRAFT_743676 [Peniophora sp. CONT]|nr:hypothetical protein PENSPDRAFT_743676 [Peniophora sp. CONT]
MPFYNPKTPAPLSLEKKVLICPIVSTANVPQLSADLLIASLDLKCVGIFDPQYLVPAIGGRDDDDNFVGVTSPLELYGRDGVNTVIIQPRSPVLKSAKEEYLSALLQFISDSHFSAVLLLTGVDVQNRTDDQMMSATYHIAPPNSPPHASTPLSSLTQIPTYTSPVTQHPLQLTQSNEGPIPFIPGGGLTRRLLTALPAQFSTPTGALLQFAAEGDNRADAAHLARVVDGVLALGVKEWRQPKAWVQGLFGTPQDQSLYG